MPYSDYLVANANCSGVLTIYAQGTVISNPSLTFSSGVVSEPLEQIVTSTAISLSARAHFQRGHTVTLTLSATTITNVIFRFFPDEDAGASDATLASSEALSVALKTL
jgi:hypothetical protein